jgi:hypothetical protein
MRNLAAAGGMCLIAWGTTGFSPDTPFPGVNALVPCLGAVLLIWAGSTGPHLLSPILQSRMLVGIGLISYPLYLWHWPLLVFARYGRIDEPGTGATLAIIGAAILLSVVSFRFIEKPVRSTASGLKRRHVFSGSILLLSATIAAGFGLWRTVATPAQLDEAPALEAVTAMKAATAALTVEKIIAAEGDIGPVGRSCPALSAEDIRDRRVCVLGNKQQTPTFILWGDSHAQALADAVSVLAARHDAAGLLAINHGCSPLLGMRRLNRENSRSPCDQVSAAVLESIIDDSTISDVILTGRWAIAAEATRFGSEQGNPAWMADDQSHEVSVAENRQVFARSLRKTIDTLVARKKRIWILASIPEIGFSVPLMLARALEADQPLDIGPDASAYFERQAFVMQQLDGVAKEPGVTVLYPHTILCPAERCRISDNDGVYYRDSHHLTQAGAIQLTPLFEQVFSTMAVPGQP